MTGRDLNRILIIDDEPDISKIVKITLESIANFTVKVCHSGKDSLAVIPEFKPDLILLDVMMPGLDGPETFNQIRELPLQTEIPVIFITAKTQSPEIIKYKALGAIAVIAKPFDPMTLTDEIKNIWDDYYA